MKVTQAFLIELEDYQALRQLCHVEEISKSSYVQAALAYAKSNPDKVLEYAKIIRSGYKGTLEELGRPDDRLGGES